MSQQCSKCDTANRPIARFCKKCGTLLSIGQVDNLDDFIGMDDIKSAMENIITAMAAIQKDGFTYSDRLHTIIMGNTGTGKTKLVNSLASIYHKFGVIKQPVPIIYDAVDYADFSKNFDANFKKAKGNILCIENVQKLIPAGYSRNVEQLDRIFRAMSKSENRLDPIIILSGQPQGFREFLNANDNVKSKFRFIFTIPDFDSNHLAQMTEAELVRTGFAVPDDARDKLKKVFKQILIKYRMPDADIAARNAWLSLRMSEDIKTSYYIRCTGTGISTRNIGEVDIKGDYDKEKTLEQVIAEIDAFIGMQGIKRAVRELIAEVGVMKERVAKGIGKEQSIGFHIVLTGNPGTGKTTVARKLGEIFKAIGVLDLGHVIEVARDKMVAQYVGQTAPQVNKLCDDAMGGLLFIDEAYTLKQNDNDVFGQEAIDTLLKRMEDDRGKFIVVIAGYPKNITTFLSSNPGLESRFDKRFRFHLEDYNADELLAIFKGVAARESYSLDVAAEELLKKQFSSICTNKDKNFGNGREARNMFEECRSLHSQRMSSLQGQAGLDAAVLTCFRPEDVPAATSAEKDISVVLQELDKLIGLSVVKEEVRKLISYLQVEKMRAKQGGKDTKLNLHFVFRGNPGTGKTTVARILADVFKSMGLLSKGNLIEVDRAGLVAQYVGQTAPKTNAVIDAAMGGVLFIDEAYTLASDTFGKEAIDTLLKRMEDDKGKFIVITAGYFAEMETFLNSNTGLMSRFTKFIDFEDYTPPEMKAIYHFMLTAKGMLLVPEADDVLDTLFDDIYSKRDRTFANGRTVRNIFERSLQNQSSRLAPVISDVSPEDLNTIRSSDLPVSKSTKKDISITIQELDKLIGLSVVKEEVRKLISYLQVEKMRAKQGGKDTKLNLHFVFRGNPGTGKTTVARILADVFKSMGLLSKGNLIEVDRAGLVAQYVGQTAPKTNAVIDAAMGGVLFIDEAYTLASDTFGKEAIDTLLKRMEDDKGKFIVIAAGYFAEMETFLNSNTGLMSRFTKFIDFEDYTPPEMKAIYHFMLTAKGMLLVPEADEVLDALFDDIYSKRDRTFANGRTVRNIFERSLQNQSSRLAPANRSVSQEELNTLQAIDITP